MKTKLTIFLLVIVSCSTWKGELRHTGNKEDAIHNVIVDYLKSNKYPINTFEIFNLDYLKKIDSNFYYFHIQPRSYYFWQEKIGQKTIALPTKYMEVNGNLFFWRDSTQVVTKELIKVLQKYKVIDSLGWKILAAENGFDLLDTMSDEENYSKWERTYIVCKKKINKYKRVKRYIRKSLKRKEINSKICK